jgi:hypothetical protein
VAPLIAILVLVLTVVSLFGWGSAVRRLGGDAGKPAVTVGVGLAALIFLGGLANLARIAYAPTLWLLAAAGLVLCLGQVHRWRPHLPRGVPARIEMALAALTIAAAIGFAIATQLAPTAFNVDDDFEKYLVYPVRMLETGTQAGDLLDALGIETLGGQSLLHGFVLSAFPLAYVNAVDAIFGLLLLLLLGASAGWRRLGALPGAALAAALIVAIDPEYVNVSALYIGAALMATGVLLVIGDDPARPPPALALGLVYAAMISVKPTFAVFAAIHLPLSLPAFIAARGGCRAGIAAVLRTVLAAAFGLAPWLALSLPKYLHAFPSPHDAVTTGLERPLDLLSTGPLFLGGSYALYTSLAALAALAAIWALLFALLRRDAAKPGRRAALGVFAGGATGALAYLALVLLIAPLSGGYYTGVRYAIPVLLAAAPITIVPAAALMPAARWRLAAALPVLATIAATIAFAPSLARRIERGVDVGTMLSYPAERTTLYQSFNRFMLSSENRRQMRALQAKVPAGETLAAWIKAPFQLDYRRNPIVDVTASGLAAPWARLPGTVHYVLWQFHGYAVRDIEHYRQTLHAPGAYDRRQAARAIAFIRALKDMAGKAKIVYIDDAFAVLRLPDVPAGTDRWRPGRAAPR